MKSLYIALLISLSFTVVGNASAEYLPSDAEAQARVPALDLVIQYLESDQVVPSRLDLRRMSADPVIELAKISTSGRYDVTLRAKAIQALALYAGDERADSTISELMESTRANHKLFAVIVMAYAQVQGEEAANELSELARHQRVDVRVAAITALGRFGGQEGYETLLKLEREESNADVRARIQTYTR